MLATLPIAGTLPASKTHRERRWAFVPTADITKPGLGVLTLVQGSRDLDSYAVDVDHLGNGCREVLFAKLDNSAEVYGVTCTSAGKPVICTCPGHQFGKRKGLTCKHMDAVTALLAEGVIESRPTAARKAVQR